MSDRNLISIPEAATLLGKHADTLHRQLKADPEFAAAVVFAQAEQFRTLISLPRLGLRVHGAAFELIRDEWYERLAEYRTRAVAS